MKATHQKSIAARNVRLALVGPAILALSTLGCVSEDEILTENDGHYQVESWTSDQACDGQTEDVAIDPPMLAVANQGIGEISLRLGGSLQGQVTAPA